MDIGTTVHGFTVESVRRIDEIEATLVEMKHVKSGAPLLWIDSADENKTFAIAFKTVPTDSTGVFHILEHSVLCGSDRFPVKEPFVELLKTSVNTFLNALTYPDKTIYPISSRNDKDFLNLLDIYMDAVLHPLIYSKPEIFCQEGWRYEFGSKEEPEYQGIVLNEMKGAYASPGECMYQKLSEQLFFGNCYAEDSGGNPECITDLTYEQFLKTHKKFYHPSNSRILLSGKVNIEDALSHLDAFLKDYTEQNIGFEIPYVHQSRCEENEIFYEIGSDESDESKTIAAKAFVIGNYDEKEKLFASIILSRYLTGDNEAPLKKAIIDAGLAQDVKISINDGAQQNWMAVEVWNTEKDRIPKIKELITDTITDICEKGLEKTRLQAVFNNFAFVCRDKDSSWAAQSLSLAMSTLDSWLYGGDPSLYLTCEDVLASLETKLETGFYSDFLRELFLENKHSTFLIMTPSKTLGKEIAEKESQKIRSRIAAMSPEKREELKAFQRKFNEWQQTPDTPENLSTIPVLKLSDIDPVPEKLVMETTESAGITVLKHKLSSKLAFMNFKFNITDLAKEELFLASLLCELIGRMPTKKHTSSEIQILTKLILGKSNCSTDVFDSNQKGILFSSDTVCLKEKVTEAAELIIELLTETTFGDLKLLQEILNQIFMQLQISLSESGQSFAILCAGAMSSVTGAAREYLFGTSFVTFVKQYIHGSSEDLSLLAERLGNLCRKIFCQSRLTLSLSDNFVLPLEKIICAFPKGEKAGEFILVPESSSQIAIPIPAGVGFAAKCFNVSGYLKDFRGSIYVLDNILNYSYLWSEIRVKGGAYGAGFVGRENGDWFFYSYRDPKPSNSLDVYDHSAEYVREFCKDNDDLTPTILGAMASADPLLNTRQRMILAETRFFKGLTYEEICETRKQLISCTTKDIMELCDVLEKSSVQNKVCVVAGQALLDSCSSKLNQQRKILS